MSGPGPGLMDPAGSPCFPPPAMRCSWRARCGGKAWGSSSYRFCSSWPTGREGVGRVCVCVNSPYRLCSSWLTGTAVCVSLSGGAASAVHPAGEVGTRLTGMFWKGLEPPCPAVTPCLVQWAQGSKQPQGPVLCISTGARRRSQSGGEQPRLRGRQ